MAEKVAWEFFSGSFIGYWLVNSGVISIFVNVYHSKKISPDSRSTAAEQSQIMGRTRVNRSIYIDRSTTSILLKIFIVCKTYKKTSCPSPW